MRVKKLEELVNKGFDTFQIERVEEFEGEQLDITKSYLIHTEPLIEDGIEEITEIDGSLYDIDVQNLKDLDYDNTNYKQANQNNRDGIISIEDYLIQALEDATNKELIKKKSIEITQLLIVNKVDVRIREAVAELLHSLI
jgi:hypothetical protein